MTKVEDVAKIRTFFKSLQSYIVGSHYWCNMTDGIIGTIYGEAPDPSLNNL